MLTEPSACEREDDSHGHWADCAAMGPDTPVEDNCDYYSFMYFRTLADA